MADYCTGSEITAQAEATQGTDPSVFAALATAVSRLFDREAYVADNFFDATDDTPAERSFVIAEKTKYLLIPPVIAASLTQILVDDVANTDYVLKDGFIVFDTPRVLDEVVKVTAKWGFAEIPADIKQACIEQAILMWRRKDLNFAEIAGVSSAVVTQELSPSFELAAKRYRDIYGSINYFV